jgi:carbamoyltransferase
MEKGGLKEAAYRLLGLSGMAPRVARSATRRWAAEAKRTHLHFQQELHEQLERLGLLGKLRRFEHHLSHAAGAYLYSGFDRALVVTLDGYGSGLSGSISLGEGGSLKRLHNLRFPHSLGSFYETVTTSLGFHPDRHAGKIVGLAAYGDPDVLSEVLLSRVRQQDGDLEIDGNLNVFLSRHLASHFPMVDVAAAYQHVLEITAAGIVQHWIEETGCDALVLSGGVTANVKMNQRLHEIDGVNRIFVDPDMGDGGCAAGLGLFLSLDGRTGEPLRDVYHGPEYTDAELRAELEREGLTFEEPANLAGEVARRIHEGEVVGRFAGRMEYGPRALGNRSILYHGRDPDVNAWLNARLGRTEFMPFAPVTMAEAAGRCYHGLAGAEHAAQFMTVTFDCTDEMKRGCPAAVHVDGTARPQIVHRDVNPGYYDILKAYEALSGIPSLINTSFNMHEEPIVCTPRDAVRAFLDGRLDGLAMGPFYVPAPRTDAAPRPGAERAAQPA